MSCEPEKAVSYEPSALIQEMRSNFDDNQLLIMAFRVLLTAHSS